MKYHGFTGSGISVGPGYLQRPLVVFGRPCRRRNRMVVTDVPVKVVVVDHLAHVVEDLVCRSDRGSGPRLEPVPKRVQVTIGPNAGVGVGSPRSTEPVLGLEDHETLLGTLLAQVIRAPYTRDASADDEHIEVLARGFGYRL